MINKQDNKATRPNYYNEGIATWDYTTSHDMRFLEGNIIKYVTRYRQKNGLEDLEKAMEYLTKLIEVEKAKVRTKL